MKIKKFIIICARKGSKGIKDKNLQKVGNASLVEHSINTAKKIKNNFIIVTSDSEKILKLSKQKKIDYLIKRPKFLSRDNSPEISVWKHAIQSLIKNLKIDVDHLIVLPPTSPLRNTLDIERCIKKYKTNKYDLVIMGYKTNHNPFFNMVKKSGNFYTIVNKLNKPIFRRQDAPNIYNISTACYVIKTKFLLTSKNVFDGKVGLVEIPIERSIDIDTRLDLKIANIIYDRNKKRV